MRWALLALLPLVYADEATTKATSTSSATSAPNCQPTNCPMTCNPGCSDSETCTIGAMTQCGVCPVLTCVSRTSVGGLDSSTSTPSPSSSQGGLVGGLVGGLAGVAIVAAIAFWYYRRNKKQRRATEQRSEKSDDASWVQNSMNSSSVIPIAYIPPSNSHASLNFASTPASSHYLSPPSTIPRPTGNSIHLSLNLNKDARASAMTDHLFDDLDDEDAVQLRMAVARPVQSPEQPPQPAVVTANDAVPPTPTVAAQAVQAVRVKPTLVRYNTLKSTSSGNKSDTSPALSTAAPVEANNKPTDPFADPKTTTSNSNDSTTTAAEDLGPFSDRYSVAQPSESTPRLNDTRGSQYTNATMSVMSSNFGDGEIPIFWEGQEREEEA
ncbi:hypothetical protein BZG36_03577 [Bifiguratus adelaidae]|uniref:Membrane anchor Opy2 N-terminal domain-containing protein n=1 Tax=Bifiguratus adelaidae TaxID=1938954 RepID=A0A261Y0B5_9FUNG|nr:hypothetical protein BZG36_03577 [Bifiguratus adelaidae]